MKVREGNRIYGKKNFYYGPKDNQYFDYERYEREITTWNEVIQPLIDEHGPTEALYKYMDWDPNWMDVESDDRDILKCFWGNLLIKSAFSPSIRKARPRAKDQKEYKHGTLELIRWIEMGAFEDEELPSLWTLEAKKGEEKGKVENSDVRFPTIVDSPKISPKDVIPNFRKHIREYLDKGLLPFLLEKIAEEKGTSRYINLNKPALTPLLDMPLKEAERRFRTIFLEYHLEKHSGNTDSAAKALGLTRTALAQKLNRSRKEVQ
jgi:hypothetical protein